MIYYCSLIIHPFRFFNRVRVEALNSFHAYLVMFDKFNGFINRFPDALILVENVTTCRYYDRFGHIVQ